MEAEAKSVKPPKEAAKRTQAIILFVFWNREIVI